MIREIHKTHLIWERDRKTDGQNRVKNCIQPLENCKSTKITKQQDEDEDQRGGWWFIWIVTVVDLGEWECDKDW